MATSAIVTDEQLAGMNQLQKIEKIKQLVLELSGCFDAELDNHSDEISHHCWVEVIEPLETTHRSLTRTVNSLIDGIENPPAEAPAAPPPAESPSPPPGDSVPVNQEDLGATQRERDRLNNQNQQQGQ